MEAEDIVSRYYGRLFFLPSVWEIALLYIGLLIIVGIVNGIPPFSIYTIGGSVYQYIIIGIAIFLMFMPLNVSKVFSVKRILGLSLAMIVASLPAELVFFRITGLRGTGMLAGSGLVFLVLTAFYTPLVSLAIASSVPLLAFVAVNELFGTLTPSTIMCAALTDLTSILAGNVFWFYIEWLGRRLSGYSPMWLMRSFLNTWLTKEPASLERVFTRTGSITDVKVKILSMSGDGGNNVLMIFPSVHFGPFRDIGSSRFIYQLEGLLEPEFKLLTFHTAGSHEHNIATSEESLRVAKEIARAVREKQGRLEYEGMCEPYRVRVEGGWEGFTLNSPSSMAVFVVNKEIGNDDLPHELWNVLEEDPRSPKVVAIADSHSFRGPKVTDVRILKPLIDAVLSRYHCNEGRDFLMGYGEASLKKNCRGVCKPKVKFFSIKANGRRYGIAYIYGNNMDGNYRIKLEDLIKSTGYKDVEVVTPDDHSCAASFEDAPYDVVRECPSLTEAVTEAAKKAMQDEIPARVSPFEITIPNVKIASERIFEFIESLSILGSRGEKGLIVLLAVVNVLPLLLYLTLF
jgi:putative membrane protein